MARRTGGARPLLTVLAWLLLGGCISPTTPPSLTGPPERTGASSAAAPSVGSLDPGAVPECADHAEPRVCESAVTAALDALPAIARMYSDLIVDVSCDSGGCRARVEAIRPDGLGHVAELRSTRAGQPWEVVSTQAR